MGRDKLRMAGVASLVAGLLLAGATTAWGQAARRPPGAGEASPPAPAVDPAKAKPPSEQADGQSTDERPRRPVDPKMIARMVDMRGPMTLLDQKPIQEELKISEEQMAKLKQGNEVLSAQREQMMRQAQQQMREAMQAAQANGGGFQGGGFPGGGGGFGNMSEQISQYMAQAKQQNDQMLAGLLSPAQRRRFDEIVLQARGPLVVAEPYMQEVLKLTPNEIQKIAAIMQELQAKQEVANGKRREMFSQLFGRGRGGPGAPGGAPVVAGPSGTQARDQAKGQGNGAEQVKAQAPQGKAANEDDEEPQANRRGGRPQIDEATRQKMEEMEAEGQIAEQEAIARIGNVLTDRHKKAYNKMLGKIFDFTLLDTTTMMGGPGGFGGRGGFGGPGGRGPGGDRGGRGGNGNN